MNKLLFVVFVYVLCCTSCVQPCDTDNISTIDSLSPEECDLEFENCVNVVYVINLDRSKDRLAYMTALLAKERIKFKRFQAINGYALRCINLESAETMAVKDISKYRSYKNPVRCMTICDIPGVRPYSCTINTDLHTTTPGEIGCTMSHRCVWQDIVDHNYKGALIFEDDIILKPGFKEHVIKLLKHLPEDADILFVGIHKPNKPYYPVSYSVDDLIELESHDLLCKLAVSDAFGGMYAYYVTQQGARKLANIRSEHHIPVDVSIPYLYSTIDGVKLNVYASKRTTVRWKNNVSTIDYSENYGACYDRKSTRECRTLMGDL